MALYDLTKLLSENTYPGRGIVIGKSADGKSALIAYFIMGRSENSRNRVFEWFENGMRTKAFDESKLSDPSLIIYNPYLSANNGNTDIITNGDQTNTIYDFINEGKTFEEALRTREYEPDHPNYTPRISGIVDYNEDHSDFTYKLSILKSANGRPEVCQRFFYEYVPESGIGHFIHTYKCDGNPIPSFYGEPEEVSLPNTAKELADLCWKNLNEDNKVSLVVISHSLCSNKDEIITINKNA
ncbi:MAG: inosine monophosphate cyclohydrolase [Ruminococcaceae bacterium]|nr:inosine monophosphate cyclohydrolase [Oscillospiraceae bacterium]MBO5041133.1 IMP cyclohydrolase [Clostridia bacterium]